MGWFWATPSAPSPLSRSSSSILPPQHPPLIKDASPPPGCPMHTPDNKSPSFPPQQSGSSSSPSATSCPVRAPNHPLRKITQSSPSTPTPTPTPTPPNTTTTNTLSKYNPLNYIPLGLTNTATPSQTYSLPLDREPSTIPRPDTSSTWEYPSPQQMYNAMLRKGYTDTDITAVESMVAVHNFLNEGAWSEILAWETLFSPGLSHAWSICSKGEAHIAQELARKEFARARRERLASLQLQNPNKTPSPPPQPEEIDTDPKLIRFQGFPQSPTPKARILSLLGTAFPTQFSSEPPFDRHDWYVERKLPDGSRKEIRYVIDYYSGGEEAGGEQVFYLDIRPALDTPTAVAERAIRWGGDVWWRASGAAVREEKNRKTQR